jgi:hypothetical protein
MKRFDTAFLVAIAVAGCGSTTLGGPDGGGGAGGAGGTGAGPCQAVVALDRSCASAADCTAVFHTINCCGQAQAIGIRASELQRFTGLETQCNATYPACGCAAQAPFADDGSRLRFEDSAGVACVAGVCTTFVADCGAPCAAGTTCFSCANGPGKYAACTTECSDSGACADPARPVCQSGSSGNTQGQGKFCTTSSVVCDTP